MVDHWDSAPANTSRKGLSEEFNVYLTEISDTYQLPTDEGYSVVLSDSEKIEGAPTRGKAQATLRGDREEYGVQVHFLPGEMLPAIGHVESIIYSEDDMSDLEGEVVTVSAIPPEMTTFDYSIQDLQEEITGDFENFWRE